jgi:hypothetical protein
MNDATVGPYKVHTNGSIGQEIRDLDGRIIAWTTDVWVAQVIAKLLNQNESLLVTKKEIDKCQTRMN